MAAKKKSTKSRASATSKSPTRKAPPRRAAEEPLKKQTGAPPGSGVFVWHELMTPDVDASRRFYTQLFGWSSHDMPMGEFNYTLFGKSGSDHAGCMKLTPPQTPMWMTYVAVPDVDASSTKAAQLGAKVHVPPTDIPGVGRFAVLSDPQGAPFSLFRPLM